MKWKNEGWKTLLEYGKIRTINEIDDDNDEDDGDGGGGGSAR